MVFSSWRNTCISAESVPIKMSRPFSAPVDLPGPDQGESFGS